MKRYFSISLILMTALLLSSCSTHLGLSKLFGSNKSSSNASATAAPTKKAKKAKRTITITSAGFSPADMKVKVGATVTWTNNDTVVESVAADDKSFDSGPINPGTSFTYAFTKAGTFTYHSSAATPLTGTVTVNP